MGVGEVHFTTIILLFDEDVLHNVALPFVTLTTSPFIENLSPNLTASIDVLT